MIGIFDEEEEQKMLAKPLEFQQRDIIGFSTFINLNNYKDKECIKQILKFVLEKNEKTNSNKSNFKSLLETKKIGLLLNERMINLSPQLVPHLHTQVQEDLKWLKQEDAMIYKNYEFDYILILSSCAQTKQN